MSCVKYLRLIELTALKKIPQKMDFFIFRKTKSIKT